MIFPTLCGISTVMLFLFSLFKNTSRDFTRLILSSVVIECFSYVVVNNILDKILVGNLDNSIIMLFLLVDIFFMNS